MIYSIRYNTIAGEHNLSVIISSDSEYVQDRGTSFVRPTRWAAYDDAINLDEKSSTKICKAEPILKAKIQDWELYDVAKNELRRFVISTGDELELWSWRSPV